MRSTLKVAIVIAIVASTALLYRRLSTTGSMDGTTIDTTTADATSTRTTTDAAGD